MSITKVSSQAIGSYFLTRFSFLLLMQCMSVNHGYSIKVEQNMVIGFKGVKVEKKVSHQLGGSTGYGDAHKSISMRGVGIAMQLKHQSYKCMKAQMKLSMCASNLLAHEDLGHLRKPVIRIYKPSSIMKNSHQHMKVTKQETLYMKNMVLL